MGNIDSGILLIVIGAAAVLGGAGFSLRAGNLVLTRSQGGGPAGSVVAMFMGLALIAVGVLMKTAWGPENAEVRQEKPTVSVSASSPPAVEPPAPTVEPSSPPVFSVAFEQPGEGARVPVTGANAAGRAAGGLADGETLWLFVASQGVHYLTTEITLASDGTFSVPSGQVGGKGDSGYTFVFEVVRANSVATKSIDNLTPNAEGDRSFKRQFPTGAAVMASRKVVRG